MKRVSCALVVTLFSGVAAAQSQQIVARHSGKCLTVEEHRGGPGVMMHLSAMTVVQHSCEASRSTQEWRTVPQAGGMMQIQSVSQNQCLTVPEASAVNNAALTVNPCAQGNRTQLWQFHPTGRASELVSSHNRKCVDVEDGGTGDGVRVVQFDCGRGDHEVFEMRSASNSGMAQVQQMQPTSNVPPQAQNGASVGGNWRWSNNTTVDFMDNGTARSSSGQTARWVREDARRVVVTWSEGWVDRLVLSDDGQHLRGSNQNGGQVSGDRSSPTAYTPPAPPPQMNNLVLRETTERTQAEANNCGAGENDPGCTLNRNGNRPLDQREFASTMENLRRRTDETQRRTELNTLFNTRVLTARQFGLLIDLFSNETLKLEVAKERMRSVLDPEHLNVFVGRFRNVLFRQQYETAMADAQRQVRGAVTPSFRGETIRR